MSSKKQKEQKPAAPKPFRTDPFAVLKGVVVEASPVPEPAKKVVVSKPKPEPAADELFLQAMAGVRKLDLPASRTKADSVKSRSQQRQVPPQVVSPHKILPREEVAARKAFLQEVDKLQLDVRFEDSLPDDELRPLSGNRLRQLKRGIIQLDRQLDLHGLTREEALAALAPFLMSARSAGEKGVLIITGKGNHSVEGPVLQQVVASWLRDQGRDFITEYAPAPQELGGGGAFIVFLRPLDKPDKD
jgi:DNA-nicking Smr family endonuclease